MVEIMLITFSTSQPTRKKMHSSYDYIDRTLSINGPPLAKTEGECTVQCSLISLR